MKDFYKVLGIDRDATEDEIARAFRDVAKRCHPDIWPGDADKEARFKETSEAKTTLLDAEKRSVYDRCLREQEERQRRDVRPFFRDHVQPVVNFANSMYGANPFVRTAKIVTDSALGDRDLTSRDLEDIGNAGASLIDFLEGLLSGRGRHNREDGT